MPARLLREGILDSERVNSLSWPAEVFYRRLMSVVDDFGRFDARASVLRTRLYPVQVERVREKDIAEWLRECESAGLIALYTVTAKPFLYFLGLGSPRAKVSKFPGPPPQTAATAENTFASKCVQVLSDVPYSGSGSYSGSNSGSGAKDCSEPLNAASEPPVAELPDEIPILEIPCVGKGPKSWLLVPSKVAEWAEAYPGVDVVTECRKARQWCLDNPAKKKTFHGMAGFLGRWLARSQNRGSVYSATSSVRERTIAGIEGFLSRGEAASDPG